MSIKDKDFKKEFESLEEVVSGPSGGLRERVMKSEGFRHVRDFLGAAALMGAIVAASYFSADQLNMSNEAFAHAPDAASAVEHCSDSLVESRGMGLIESSLEGYNPAVFGETADEAANLLAQHNCAQKLSESGVTETIQGDAMRIKEDTADQIERLIKESSGHSDYLVPSSGGPR